MCLLYFVKCSPGLELYSLPPRGCSDRSRLSQSGSNLPCTPKLFHLSRVNSGHLVQIKVGRNDAVESVGESHQAGWKFKADKSSQHLMIKYDGDGDDDGFDSVGSSVKITWRGSRPGSPGNNLSSSLSSLQLSILLPFLTVVSKLQWLLPMVGW